MDPFAIAFQIAGEPSPRLVTFGAGGASGVSHIYAPSDPTRPRDGGTHKLEVQAQPTIDKITQLRDFFDCPILWYRLAYRHDISKVGRIYVHNPPMVASCGFTAASNLSYSPVAGTNRHNLSFDLVAYALASDSFLIRTSLQPTRDLYLHLLGGGFPPGHPKPQPATLETEFPDLTGKPILRAVIAGEPEIRCELDSVDVDISSDGSVEFVLSYSSPKSQADMTQIFDSKDSDQQRSIIFGGSPGVVIDLTNTSHSFIGYGKDRVMVNVEPPRNTVGRVATPLNCALIDDPIGLLWAGKLDGAIQLGKADRDALEQRVSIKVGDVAGFREDGEPRELVIDSIDEGQGKAGVFETETEEYKAVKLSEIRRLGLIAAWEVSPKGFRLSDL